MMLLGYTAVLAAGQILDTPNGNLSFISLFTIDAADALLGSL
jgi:hypothetical protein